MYHQFDKYAGRTHSHQDVLIRKNTNVILYVCSFNNVNSFSVKPYLIIFEKNGKANSLTEVPTEVRVFKRSNTL